jgi:hypothetical protein
MANDPGKAILTTLRTAGVVLSIDDSGDLVLGGAPRALATWHAMAGAVEGLPAIVIAALAAEVQTRSAGTESTADPAAAAGDLARFGDGAARLMEAIGGGPPRPVPIDQAQATTPPAPKPGRVRAPMVAGVYIATPQFQAWRERWRQAAAAGQGDAYLAANPAPYRFPGDGGP